MVYLQNVFCFDIFAVRLFTVYVTCSVIVEILILFGIRCIVCVLYCKWS